MKVVRADAEGERVTAEWLLQGGVAVVPTDTVYGLAARPVAADAVRTIYRLKGRPEGMHLPVLAASVDQVRALGVAFTPGSGSAGPALVARTADARLRVRAAASNDPNGWTGAPRSPSGSLHTTFLRAVLQQTGVLVVTSANPHGAPTPRTAEDVAGALGSAVRPGRRWRGAAGRPLDAGQRQRARTRPSSARAPFRGTPSTETLLEAP